MQQFYIVSKKYRSQRRDWYKMYKMSYAICEMSTADQQLGDRAGPRKASDILSSGSGKLLSLRMNESDDILS